MKLADILKENAGRLKSKVGACFPGDRVIFRGHDLHADLKDLDWFDLYSFGITGRRLPATHVRMLHAIWVCTSYPDARIWNNRVAALAGNARSTGTLGIAAALAVSEASIYGGGIYIPSISFLQRTLKAIANGADLFSCVKEELQQNRGIAGYGRPLTSRDERIFPIMELARTLELGDGPHVKLAFAVDQLLIDKRLRLRMNYGAISAAICADIGLSPREYHLMVFPAFLAGMPPCFIENSERAEGTLFPLACDDILYEGPPKREWIR